jgi:hypothetical protein
MCLAQAAAQATAAEAAAEGLAGSLRAAEARCTALAESVAELQDALERQRAAADLREEMLRQVCRLHVLKSIGVAGCC